jgi:hypothetical protein
LHALGELCRRAGLPRDRDGGCAGSANGGDRSLGYDRRCNLRRILSGDLNCNLRFNLRLNLRFNLSFNLRLSLSSSLRDKLDGDFNLGSRGSGGGRGRDSNHSLHGNRLRSSVCRLLRRVGLRLRNRCLGRYGDQPTGATATTAAAAVGTL